MEVSTVHTNSAINPCPCELIIPNASPVGTQSRDSDYKEERRSLVECEAGLDESLLMASGFTFTKTTCREGRGQSLFRSRQWPEWKGRACFTPTGVLTNYMITNLVV
jgi:hypothetical protein